MRIHNCNNLLSITSPQFPGITGVGKTELKAIKMFFAELNVFLRESIKKQQLPPKPILPTSLINREGHGSFNLPLQTEIAILLVEKMIESFISPGRLAKLLALTEEEVSYNWQLKHTRSKEPRQKPKYKNVQRLLNIDHESTLAEIVEAFRVLNYKLTISLEKITG